MKKLQFLLFVLITSWAFAQSYDLKLNLEKGKTYELMQNIKMDMKQNIQGQDINLLMGGVVGLTAMVESQKEDVYKLKTIYTFTESSFEGMGQKFTFSSESSSDNELNKVLQSIVGKPFYIYLSNKGKVTKLEGNEEILNEIKKEFEGNLVIEQGQILSMYKEETISQMFDLIYSFPTEQVKVGSSWNVNYVTLNPYKVSNDTNFTLKKVDQKYYIIDFSSNLKTLSNQVIELNGIKASPDLTGSSNGQLMIDKKSGWVSGLNSKGSMNGVVNLVEMEGMKIDMKMEMETTYTPQSEYISPPPPMQTKQ